ncbi:MAG: 1-acyl-sn-glycerol-3-phosphate acyltransferase [Cryomorphaceae bacterium]|nr:1-acyl-sn-glycerol-3-phosphate acyltransferase [Cryomorphaceae bacterium]
MKIIVAKWFLKITGWELKVPEGADLSRCVMLAAPHTSNWDYPIAQAACWILGIKWKYFIKDFYTKNFLLGWFFKATGAIGVNRSQRKLNLVDFAIKQFSKYDDLVVLVPAEGTRKRVEKWRTGFYHIALGAKVPIALGFMDYGKKHTGVLAVFTPTGDFKKDMRYIESEYKKVTPRYPDKYNEKIF